jgi:hypothetical protein
MRALLFASLVVLGACGGDDPKAYPSYQECFDDQTEKEQRPVVDSIVKCCIEHEIAKMPGPVCGNNEADCINFLTTNLSQTDADITVQTEACTAYVAAKAM